MTRHLLTALLFLAAFPAMAEDTTLDEANAQALLADALRFAGEQRYPESIAAFEKVKAQRPEAIVSIQGLKMAVVYAQVGDVEKFDAHSRWLIARYKDAELATDAERSVKGYLLFAGPHDPALLAEALVRTRYAVEAAAKAGEAELLPWFYLSHGMAEYRMKNYAEAATWLAKVADDETLYIGSLAQAFHAMAVHGQGQHAEALALLEKARATATTLPAPGTEEYKEEWPDTLSTQLAMGEAEALIAK
ncbi:MAG: hypothetical protein JNK74_01475 [Candidatus Hydrogenedentes bacterium]|nr:hypothetical protein [Candidatus Hydrogenedentota bacterium]